MSCIYVSLAVFDLNDLDNALKNTPVNKSALEMSKMELRRGE
jgi:hypothetical protein